MCYRKVLCHFYGPLVSFLVVIGVRLFLCTNTVIFEQPESAVIKIHRFLLEFSKVLAIKKIDKQGTEFAISSIPLGGYVRCWMSVMKQFRQT